MACDFDDPPGQPDVAVVLSGGGALAATQIGALRVVEEAGVPVHCIVGTSMGAIVAGLYGAGYDANEIRDGFVGANWVPLITGQALYRDQSFRDKELGEVFFTDFVAGRDETGITLPGGYQSLRRMRLALRQTTTDVSDITDFDDLPTPVRVVGTDLSRGEGITLARGDLVEAMLASMAVPGVYPAVEYDGEILVDGGMSKQVAIDVARDMGADVVIVIDTTVIPPERDRVPNLAATVQSLVQIAVWQNWTRQIELLREGDIHIRPDITGLSTSSFGLVELGYDRGVEAAREHQAELEALAQRAAPPTRWKPERIDSFVVADVTVGDNSGIDESLIIGRLAVEPGDELKRTELQEKAKDVEALGAFGSVDYYLSPAPTGRVVRVDTTDRPLGKDLFQIGARFSNTFDGFSDYELAFRWSRRPINSYAGELSLVTEVGDDILVEGEWFQPIGDVGRYYFAPSAKYQALNVPIQLDTLAINENRIQQYAANLQVGRELGLWGIASVDVFLSRVDTEPKFTTIIGDPGEIIDNNPGLPSGGVIEGRTIDYAGTRARFAGDTFNALNFPTRGYGFDVSVTYFYELSDILDDEEVLVTRAEGAAATEFAGLGFYGSVEAGNVDGDRDLSTVTFLGGFKRISGARDQSIPATRYGLARLEAYKRLTPVQNVTGLDLYLGGTVELSDIEFEADFLAFDDSLVSASAYAAFETPIGPAYFAYGYTEGGRDALYFFFGRTF